MYSIAAWIADAKSSLDWEQILKKSILLNLAWAVSCELWTVNYKPWAVNCEMCIVGCELWAVNCEFWIVTCELWTVSCELWAVNCELCTIASIFMWWLFLCGRRYMNNKCTFQYRLYFSCRGKAFEKTHTVNSMDIFCNVKNGWMISNMESVTD